MNDESQMTLVDSGTIAQLNKSEIDMQIATAHKYPRSIKKFRQHVEEMVTLSESIAAECIYSLPRDGKTIEGPSARFAEVVASAWGNSRAGARVVAEDGQFITAQGVFHDLETNVAITFEVQRRITDKHGKTYKPDMIGVTGNAASSIALRNAILKGVPKAYWSDMYEGARKTAKGDYRTLPNRRAEAIKAFMGYGVTEAQVLTHFGKPGLEDIGLEELLIMRGLLTALRDGDTTPEQVFEPDPTARKGPPVVPRKTDGQNGQGAPIPPSGDPTVLRQAIDAAAVPHEQAAGQHSKPDADGVIELVEPRHPDERPTPPPPAARDDDNQPATPGERQMLRTLMAKARVDIISVFERAKVPSHVDPGSLEGISKGQFRAMKAALS